MRMRMYIEEGKTIRMGSSSRGQARTARRAVDPKWSRIVEAMTLEVLRGGVSDYYALVSFFFK